MSDNFIMIPEYAGKILKLKHDDLIVYGIIYGFSKNEKGKYFGSLKYIQDMTGCSQDHICRILKRLTEKGYIRKNAINARRIEYTVVPLDELTAKGLIRQTKEKAVTSPPENSSIGENIENNTTMKTDNELRKEHDRVYQKVLEKANQK